MKLFLRSSLLCLTLVGLSGDRLSAAVIAVDLADYSGTRTEAAGEVVTQDDWNGDGVTFSWEITYDGNTGLYTYLYTVAGNGSPAISHLDIAASDGRDGTTIFTSANVKPGTDGPLDGPGELNSGGFGAPSNMYGIRFDFGDEAPQSYTLVTDRAPIWGSFHAKAGRDSGAYNIGWSTWGDYLADTGIPNFAFDKTQWVAVPDSVTINEIPEPSTIALSLIGLGFVGLASAGRRFKRN